MCATALEQCGCHAPSRGGGRSAKLFNHYNSHLGATALEQWFVDKASRRALLKSGGTPVREFRCEGTLGIHG